MVLVVTSQLWLLSFGCGNWTHLADDSMDFGPVRKISKWVNLYRIKVTGKVGWFAQASALGFLTRATLRGGMGGGGGGGGGIPGPPERWGRQFVDEGVNLVS